MSKHVCVCGNGHTGETPLVITITTCPGGTKIPQDSNNSKHKAKDNGQLAIENSSSSSTKNKNKNQKTGTENSSEKSVKSDKSDKSDKNDNEAAIDRTLLCNNKECPGTPKTKQKKQKSGSEKNNIDKNDSEAAIDRLLYCANKECSSSPKPKQRKQKNGAEKSNSDKNDSEAAIDRLLFCGNKECASATKPKQKKQRNGSEKNNNDTDSEVAIESLIYCDNKECPIRPSRINTKSATRAEKNAKSSKQCPWDIFSLGSRSESKKSSRMEEPPKPSKTEQRELREREKAKREKPEKKERGVGNLPRDKTDTYSNIPSDATLKLPILVPRYHGKGCAIEVDIMEKHDKTCSYKKQKNYDRIPVDDRSGSYEIIGRLVFKTCQQDNRSPTNESLPTNKYHRESTFTSLYYSLINMPFWTIPHTNVDVHPTSSKSDRELQVLETYLKRKMVFESLAKSSKSFPTNLHESAIDFETSDSFLHQEIDHSLTSYEVEELYISEEKTNKSVQISDSCFSKQRQKKWLDFLLPCLHSDESFSSLPLYSEETNTD